jgi:hypothetical protein
MKSGLTISPHHAVMTQAAAVDHVGEFGSGRDASIMPRRNYPLPLQGDEVLFQLIAQVLVSMRV